MKVFHTETIHYSLKWHVNWVKFCFLNHTKIILIFVSRLWPFLFVSKEFGNGNSVVIQHRSGFYFKHFFKLCGLVLWFSYQLIFLAVFTPIMHDFYNYAPSTSQYAEEFYKFLTVNMKTRIFSFSSLVSEFF